MANLATDDLIAERVTQALWADPFLEPVDVNVTVRAGAVTLSGSVETRAECDAIMEALDDLYCCDIVINHLQVHETQMSTAA